MTHVFIIRGETIGEYVKMLIIYLIEIDLVGDEWGPLIPLVLRCFSLFLVQRKLRKLIQRESMYDSIASWRNTIDYKAMFEKYLCKVYSPRHRCKQR